MKKFGTLQVRDVFRNPHTGDYNVRVSYTAAYFPGFEKAPEVPMEHIVQLPSASGAEKLDGFSAGEAEVESWLHSRGLDWDQWDAKAFLEHKLAE